MRSESDLPHESDAADRAIRAREQGAEGTLPSDFGNEPEDAAWRVAAARRGFGGDDRVPADSSPWIAGEASEDGGGTAAAWRGFGKADPLPDPVAWGEGNRLTIDRTLVTVEEEELTPDRIFFALSELPVISWILPTPVAMAAGPAVLSGATEMLPLPPPALLTEPGSAVVRGKDPLLPPPPGLLPLPLPLPLPASLPEPPAANTAPTVSGLGELATLHAAPHGKNSPKASRFPEPSYRYPPARLPPEMLRTAQRLPANLPAPRIMVEQPQVSSRFRSINPQSWFDDAMRFALQAGASDLHLTLDIVNVRLVARLRIDGIMEEFAVIEGNDARTIMGRFKAAAELSSGGSFVPEESLYSINVDGELRKARVALFRDHNAGDALVLRLPPTGELLSLDELGFGESNLMLFRKLLRAANRMVLIAGPMGSGKTTTAHAALKQVTTTERIVWSVEDPVERDLPGVVQLEVDEANGAGFSTLLPVLVRSDYDTLFLGEIRDKATAAAGVRQSKAGRQVITTIHANDNVTALLRLIELAEDSPLSCMDAVRGVVSQRLMRRLNPNWNGETAAERYKGRVPVHEVLIMNDELTEAVMRDQPIREIKKIAAAASENTFERDAQRLIDTGITDQKEVDRVLGE